MPIYEYDCKNCRESFELLRPMSGADKGVVCTFCGAKNVQRKLSVFAAGSMSKTPDFAGSPCGCGAPPELSCANTANQCEV